MIKKFQADFVLPVSSPSIRNGIVIVGEDDEILETGPPENFPGLSVQRLKGILVPGFINSHCHLELSHMYNKVPTGTGLLRFMERVVKLRGVNREDILQAIKDADESMWKNGIVAVGDISNNADTAVQKNQSRICYHTFVECFDLLQPSWTKRAFDEGINVLSEFASSGGNCKSLVPHAPYSVTPKLFSLIDQYNEPRSIVSIHSQEIEAENLFFQSGAGPLIDFFRMFDLEVTDFRPGGITSVSHTLDHISSSHPLILVHNTTSSIDDLRFVRNSGREVYWVTCPNANLYIENRLPDYQKFLDEGVTIAVGTDSLTSNWQLSILDEIKTINKYQSYISFEELIRWATINGARALGLDQRFGTIEKGKKPGLNLLSGDTLNLTSDTSITKII